MSQNRKLIIIDDQLFNVFQETASNAPDLSGIIERPVANEPLYRIGLENNRLSKLLDDKRFVARTKKYLPLHYIISHAARGNFCGLKEILVLDLDENIYKIAFFSEAEALEHEHVKNSAILLDIYSERDQFPTGLDIAESLDQSPFTDRIAWLSVTGTLSSDFKPYPLLRKREIPPPNINGRKKEDKDTIFLWWGWLFGDFEMEGETVPTRTPQDIVTRLREEKLVTLDNIEEVKNYFLIRRGKSARKGGLAGNIIEPVFWKKHGGDEKGKIVNALLKISGKKEKLDDELRFLVKRKYKRTFPEILYPDNLDVEQSFYCMEKIKGDNFSDFIFEKIGFADTKARLRRVLEKIYEWHSKSRKIKTPFQDVTNKKFRRADFEKSIILEYVGDIKGRIKSWVDHNKFFEPLIYPKMLIINNLQYFNALYLCDRIEAVYKFGDKEDQKQEIIKIRDKLRSLEPKFKIRIHGDIVAQNIFFQNGKLRLIDPRGGIADYLVDYYKLFSSFSGQGHIEYLSKKQNSKSAHFYVNEGIRPDACFYVCSPSLEDPKGIKSCQKVITDFIDSQNKNAGVYSRTEIERDPKSWRNRFLLGLAKQYLGAPPYRDNERFHDEMKFFYYRGVEILNEFCERMSIIEHRQRIFKMK
ncbi:MAG: hypothetical protein ISS63_07550 [Desulfobacteraceae bacterium]|nr:hypothetical protein [Desulfobacteraceae bacterium]